MSVAAPAAREGQVGTGGTEGVEAGNRSQPCLHERAHDEEKKKENPRTQQVMKAKFDFAGYFLKVELRERAAGLSASFLAEPW